MYIIYIVYLNKIIYFTNLKGEILMKKFLKGFLLFFCLPVALIAAFVYGSIFYVRNVEPFNEHAQSKHFYILYNNSEADIINDVENKLENNYANIKKDLKIDDTVGLDVHTVMIHPDLNSLQSKMIGLPWWIADMFKAAGYDVPLRNPQNVGGTDNYGFIRIVSPANPGESGFTYDQVLDVVTHELTRKAAKQIGGDLLEFTKLGYTLSEGLATYEANQGYMYDYDNEDFNSTVLEMLPESIDDFDITNQNVRPMVGYSLVKYVSEKYGFDKVLDLIKKDYSNGYDEETKTIYDSWIDYLKSN